jgi:hypothetical protein
MAEIALPTTGLEKHRQIDCAANFGSLVFVAAPQASTSIALTGSSWQKHQIAWARAKELMVKE